MIYCYVKRSWQFTQWCQVQTGEMAHLASGVSLPGTMHILEEEGREGRGLSGNALGGHLLKAIRPLQWAASGVDNARRWPACELCGSTAFFPLMTHLQT